MWRSEATSSVDPYNNVTQIPDSGMRDIAAFCKRETLPSGCVLYTFPAPEQPPQTAEKTNLPETRRLIEETLQRKLRAAEWDQAVETIVGIGPDFHDAQICSMLKVAVSRSKKPPYSVKWFLTVIARSVERWRAADYALKSESCIAL